MDVRENQEKERKKKEKVSIGFWLGYQDWVQTVEKH